MKDMDLILFDNNGLGFDIGLKGRLTAKLTGSRIGNFINFFDFEIYLDGRCIGKYHHLDGDSFQSYVFRGDHPDTGEQVRIEDYTHSRNPERRMRNLTAYIPKFLAERNQKR